MKITRIDCCGNKKVAFLAENQQERMWCDELFEFASDLAGISPAPHVGDRPTLILTKLKERIQHETKPPENNHG